jgi:hypothetical protein
MNAPERVLSRVRQVVGTAGLEELGPAGVRSTLRAVTGSTPSGAG